MKTFWRIETIFKSGNTDIATAKTEKEANERKERLLRLGTVTNISITKVRARG